MKLNKIMMAAVMVFGVTSVAQAENPIDQGHGSVTFIGSIIDAPCSISPDSIDQTVNLGQVSNVMLEKNGTSKPQMFDIKLENCTKAASKFVKATFTGPAGGVKGSLGLGGTARGASIVMTDGNGSLIKVGTPTSAYNLFDGDNTMVFSAYLQGNPDGVKPEDTNVIVPGDFKTVANFTLAYE